MDLQQNAANISLAHQVMGLRVYKYTFGLDKA